MRSNSMCSKYVFIFSKKHRNSRSSNSSNGKDVIDGGGGEICKRNSLLSDYSSSDDGGFLPRKRRPILSYPSQLSFQSFQGSDQSTYSRLLRRFNLLRGNNINNNNNNITDVKQSEDGIGLYKNVQEVMSPGIYVNTPIRGSGAGASHQIHSSSPATGISSPPYFSDLSSVPPNSAEKVSFSAQTQQQQIQPPQRSYDRYFHTLPRLHAISEENTRFVPVHVPTPDGGNFYQNFPLPYEFRSRHLPISRSKRSLPDSFPLLNIAHHFIDASPSDSSGFGSKNTSSQLQSSSHSSGFLPETTRFLPPYRPPPAPISNNTRYRTLQSPSQYSMSHWLELISRLRASNDPKRITTNTSSSSTTTKWTNKEFDVGSVDGHYEFDPSTPSICTPTGLEFADTLFTRKRSLRIENIDARVQAMKEEFSAWRQSQERHKGVQSTQAPNQAKLETVC